jgi:uncharacterized protein (DUF952 family)
MSAMSMSSPAHPLPDRIYHICAAADWRAAQQAGVYRGSAAARADGFLHLSTAEQVAGSLAKHYPDPAGFVILTVRTAALGDVLRWEPSRGGALFPHCYGEVPLEAVEAVAPAGDWAGARSADQP